ncbi:MAG TPA: ABC transporter ATP-binding protein [Spirochaetia bacterium]|nr:ABC transporter ATP-binding protein [Spirochaetia bacterium]
MAFLELIDVVKHFGRHTAVQGFTLSAQEGELISFLGGSGCGKTTTLRMIAGFEVPTAGRILISGRDVVPVAPNRRGVGMVFQNYALFPNMTVARNIGFGLRVAGRPGSEISRRVDEMLELIHMSEFRERYPHQMSGGQQQRVALARALAIRPSVLLLDEPLSALDAKIRVRLRAEIRAIQRSLGITTIYVTHDQEEALSISDRIVVMKDGRIEQVGTPFEIYNRPATGFVASFIGSSNALRAVAVHPEQGTASVDGQEISAARPLPALAGQEVRLQIRPEAISLHNGVAHNNHLRGTLVNVVFLGSIVRLVVSTGGSELMLDMFNNPHLALPEVGSTVTVGFAPEACVPLETNGE